MEELKVEPARSRLEKATVVLRALSGFSSALTSSIITVIFSLTIYESVLKSNIGYPDATKIFIMIMGPLISSFQFINVSSTLSAIFKHINKPPEGEEQPIVIDVGASATVEVKIYGRLNVLLRAVAGFVCCHVICFASLMFTYVIHLGVIAGKGLPNDYEMIVTICGPIITSWTFMRAETTIKELLKIDSFLERFRKGSISVLSSFGKKE